MLWRKEGVFCSQLEGCCRSPKCIYLCLLVSDHVVKQGIAERKSVETRKWGVKSIEHDKDYGSGM